MAHPVVHFEIHGKDLARLSQFYGELFGWQINSDNAMGYGVVDTNAAGQGINGGIAADERAWVTFYVQAPDVQAALDHAISLGGKLVMPVQGVPGGIVFALFEDPGGNVVGIVQE